MARFLTLAALALPLAGAAASSARLHTADGAFVRTPSGLVPSECFHRVPAGTEIVKGEDGSYVAVTAENERRALPRCTSWAKVGSHTRQPSVRGAGGRQLQFPSDYEGWLEYAVAKIPGNATGFSAFTSIFTTPTSLPTSDPDVLYLFPGVQNVDWVPLVDPIPSGPFDILQPVLQYPGDMGDYWSVKSWWVTLDIGAVASDEVQLQPGDAIFGNMTKLGPERWFIDSVNTRSKQHTSVVTPASMNSRVGSQPWAYITLECYGCGPGCGTYPAAGSACNFEQMLLVADGGQAVNVTWTPNAKPSSNHYCNEGISISDSATAQIYFDGPAPQ